MLPQSLYRTHDSFTEIKNKKVFLSPSPSPSSNGKIIDFTSIFLTCLHRNQRLTTETGQDQRGYLWRLETAL